MIRFCIKSKLRIFSDGLMKCQHGHLFYYLKGFDNTCPFCYKIKAVHGSCRFCDEYLGELHSNVESLRWRRDEDWIEKSEQGEKERSKHRYDPNLFTTT